MSDSYATDSVADPLSRLRDITSAHADRDVLERLGSAGLVNLARDVPSRDVLEDARRAGTDLTATFADDDATALDAAPVGRVNPRRSRLKLSDGRLLGMYVAECYISTEAEPAYHRLPSFSSHNPYHIVYLDKFPPNELHTVSVTLQVFSAGTIRISGTGVAASLTVGQSSVPLSVPVGLRTTDQGFASILIQRNGQVGFDWFSAVVL